MSRNPRLEWAVAKLDPAPSDRVLEIGCGNGAAAALICSRLTGGRLVAIDRSAAMIARARSANAEAVAAGKASFEVASFEQYAGGRQRFDKVFAFNVNLFLHQPEPALRLIHRLLSPGGRVLLCHQAPAPGGERQRANELEAALLASGFEVIEVAVRKLAPAPAWAVTAAPQGLRRTRSGRSL